jgi:hypothetical protein
MQINRLLSDRAFAFSLQSHEKAHQGLDLLSS